MNFLLDKPPRFSLGRYSFSVSSVVCVRFLATFLAVFGIIAARVSSFTGFAMSAKSIRTFLQARIFRTIWMSLWAVGFIQVLVRTTKILSQSYRFHMFWINTLFIFAKMVNNQTVRDASHFQFIRHAMSQYFALSNSQRSISTLSNMAGPNQAGPQFWPILRDFSRLRFLVETVPKWFGRSGLNPFFPISKMSAVMGGHIATP